MRRLLILLCLLVAVPGVAQDLSLAGQREYIGDVLQVDSREALTGTWTCTTSSLTCTGVAGGDAEIAQDELADGDIVELCTVRYVVNGEPPTQGSILVTAHRVASTGALKTGADVACVGGTAYKAGLGATATFETVDDGSGTATALQLSTGGVNSTGTLGAGGLTTLTIDGNNAATEFVQITNSNVPATGETGDTAAISFDLFGSVGGVVAAHEAARIEAYKVSDWFHATTEGDHDSGLKFYNTIDGAVSVVATLSGGSLLVNDLNVYGNMRVGYAGNIMCQDFKVGTTADDPSNAGYTSAGTDGFILEGATADATEFKLNFPPWTEALGDLTGEICAIDAAVNDGQLILGASAATSVVTFDGADAAGNWVGLDFSDAAGFNDVSDYWIKTATASNQWTADGGLTAAGITTGGNVIATGNLFGARLRLSSTVLLSGSANTLYVGYDGMVLEGGAADADELNISLPAFNDGGAGDQGGESDPTATMIVGRCPAVTVADTGADATPATATLDPVAHANCYVYTCNDDDTCDVTMAEATAFPGQILAITNTTANALDFADQAGILNINGGAIAIATDDTLTLMYTGTSWLELSRSDN